MMLARRARRLFGAPRPYQWFRSIGVRVTQTEAAEPPGEWVAPRVSSGQTLLYLHGGGYVSCSPATHRPITAALARFIPAQVFAPAYRLAPEHPYPAALDDAECAYHWLLGSGISPQVLALAGDSAGGGLALALLLRLRDSRVPLPACVVLFSPWTDLTGSGASLRENDGKCAMFRPENVGAFAACYASSAALQDTGVSPLFGPLLGLPPILVQVGVEELLRDDAVRLHAKIQAAGGVCELAVYHGAFHGWHMLDGLVPEARAALAQAGRFVHATTRKIAT